MDNVNTSLADSTEFMTGVSELMEKYTDEILGQGKVSGRNFGEPGSLRSSAPASSGDTVAELSVQDLPKPYIDHMDEFLKVEPGQWSVISSKALKDTFDPESSSGMGGFIKDEPEQSLILEHPSTDFDLRDLESCCDPDNKQPCGYTEDSTTLLSSQGAQQVLDSSSNFQLDVSQSNALGLPPQRRASPSLGGGMVNFNGRSASPIMAKTDISKWVVQQSRADSPFWRSTKSTNVNEEHAGYSSDSFIQRTQTGYGVFPG